MLRTLSALTLLISLISLSTISAGAQVSNSGANHATVHAQTIINYLNEIGIVNEISRNEDGSLGILTPTNDGNVLIILMKDCAASSGPGCNEMAVVVASPTVGLPYASALKNLAVMNAINVEFDLGKAFTMDGMPLYGRYEHFAFGINKGNLMNDIAGVAMFSDLYFQTLAALKQQADQTPGFAKPVPQISDGASAMPDVEHMAGVAAAHSAGGLSDLLSSAALQTYLQSEQFRDSPVLFAVQPGGTWPGLKR